MAWPHAENNAKYENYLSKGFWYKIQRLETIQNTIRKNMLKIKSLGPRSGGRKCIDKADADHGQCHHLPSQWDPFSNMTLKSRESFGVATKLKIIVNDSPSFLGLWPPTTLISKPTYDGVSRQTRPRWTQNGFKSLIFTDHNDPSRAGTRPTWALKAGNRLWLGTNIEL